MRYLKNALLVLLAIVSFATLGTAAVWNLRPEYVQWLDTKWCNRHRKIVDNEYGRLVELGKVDQKAAIAPMEALADTLHPYEKADYRYHTRKRVLRTLSEFLVGAGEFDRAVKRADELRKLDDRDISTRIWFGQLFVAHPETHEIGIDELNHLFQELPEHGVVARSYNQALLKDHRDVDAVAVVVRHLDSTLSSSMSEEEGAGPWEYWWSTGEPFAVERRKRVRADSESTTVQIPFELPAGTQKIRFDAPPWSVLAGHTPTLEFHASGVSEALEVAWESVKTNQLQFSGSSMKSFGESDPWWILDVPERWSQKPLNGTLTVQLGGFPYWIQDTLLLPSAANYLASSAESISARTLERIQDARLQGLLFLSLGLELDGSPFAPVAIQERRADHLRFDQTIMGPELEGDTLRIVLPPVIGVRVEVEELQIQYETRSVTVPLVDSEGCSQATTRTWITETPSASLTATLDRKLGAIKSVDLKGTLR